MRKSVLLAVANIALSGLICGCGESVPQRDAVGGVLSGTAVERQRMATARRNPLQAGNGQQAAAPQRSAAPSTMAATQPVNRAAAPATNATE